MPLILGTNSIKDTGYNVANSLRFNSGSSDSLDRTVSSSPTNPDKFTISVWVKRSKLGSEQAIIGQYSSSNFRAKIDFLADDRIEYIQKNDGNTSANIITTRKFRDPSAWIHIVFQYDSTQGTDSNRIKLYFNGTQETSFDATSYPAQNLDGKLNQASVPLDIGQDGNSSIYFSGYMAEFVLVDGQALDPTSFGEFNSDSPTIWQPIDVSGLTFGDDGFYLDFENSSSLGADVSGNGNNFTVNNLTSIDQSTDTCTNNFATLNPLNPIVHDFEEGNLRIDGTTTNWDSAFSTIGASSGKWYFEMKFLALEGGLRRASIGVVDARDQTLMATNEVGYNITGTVGDSVGYNGNGSNNVKKNDSAEYSGTNWNVDDIICMAVDLDNGAIYFRVNGSAWLNSGDPTSGSSKTGAVTITVGETYVFGGTAYGSSTEWQFNFGSPSYSESGGNSDGNGYGNFNQSVPSGYYSLNSKNLAEYG
jgi:hypothetical protein